MPRAIGSTLLAFWLCQLPMAVQARPSTDRTGSLISDRREVPLDPLDGIPEEGQSGKSPKAQNRPSTCRLLVTPANDRDIADLRSTVAIMQRGPKNVACPSDVSPLRLRLSIDAQGRIASVERITGDIKLGDSLARALTGQLCTSAVSSATKGVAQIQLRRVVK